ncbi:MAG: hypothetical protein GY731_09065 [Gammaproteobacteria bacterium]|nr:hypothetical protein [Gammaproteobacteria bacterium]
MPRNRPQPPIDIPVEVNNPARATPIEEPELTDEQLWSLLRQELVDASAAGQWIEVFRILHRLSSKQSFTDHRKAFAQRVWVALKADVPPAETVESLKEWVIMLGTRHELSGAIAVLAYQIARKRAERMPDNGFSMVQAQQLLNLVCQTEEVKDEDGFNKWVATRNLDDPGTYLPQIMEGLEMMILDDWWFDREALQADLDQYQTRASNSPA